MTAGKSARTCVAWIKSGSTFCGRPETQVVPWTSATCADSLAAFRAEGMTQKPRVCTATGWGARTVARRRCRTHYQAAWKADELGSYEKLSTKSRLRDRTICPPDHKHADATICFIQHQCRCDPGTDHNSVWEVRRRKNIAYGRCDSGLVDVPVREHLPILGEFGLGVQARRGPCQARYHPGTDLDLGSARLRPAEG